VVHTDIKGSGQIPGYVGVGVNVGVCVNVCVTVCVGVNVGVCVNVCVTVCVGVNVCVTVCVGVNVCVGVGVGVGVGHGHVPIIVIIGFGPVSTIGYVVEQIKVVGTPLSKINGEYGIYPIGGGLSQQGSNDIKESSDAVLGKNKLYAIHGNGGMVGVNVGVGVGGIQTPSTQGDP